MRAYDAMVQGKDYWINDPELVEIRYQTRDRVDLFNALGARETEQKTELIQQIFGQVGDNVHIEKPMRIDYGCNIELGSNVFINFNWTVLDTAKITIGSNVFIGPNVSMYAAHHPLDSHTRARHIGSAEPIHIGSDVWIGGDTVILPGVTIGDRCIIGAGSLVSRDIEPGMVAIGRPCRAIKAAE